MKTITIDLYEIDELSEEAQKKVIDDNRYVNVDFEDWHSYITEEEEVKLAVLGYEDVEIRFSGFHSQGDGASFTAKINLEKWINHDKEARSKFLTLNQYDISAWIDTNCVRSCHENTMSACTDMEAGAPETMLDLENELQETLEKEAKELAQDIYRTLASDYDSLTSDEAVKETIEVNEYTFEHDGTMRLA
jgi:hypothetical protein